MTRYFVFSTDSVYEAARAEMDAGFGYPTQDGLTATCIQPSATADRNSLGQVVLLVGDEFCACEAVAAVLPSLLASGSVEEITEDEYRASLPSVAPDPEPA